MQAEQQTSAPSQGPALPAPTTPASPSAHQQDQQDQQGGKTTPPSLPSPKTTAENQVVILPSPRARPNMLAANKPHTPERPLNFQINSKALSEGHNATYRALSEAQREPQRQWDAGEIMPVTLQNGSRRLIRRWGPQSPLSAEGTTVNAAPATGPASLLPKPRSTVHAQYKNPMLGSRTSLDSVSESVVVPRPAASSDQPEVQVEKEEKIRQSGQAMTGQGQAIIEALQAMGKGQIRDGRPCLNETSTLIVPPGETVSNDAPDGHAFQQPVTRPMHTAPDKEATQQYTNPSPVPMPGPDPHQVGLPNMQTARGLQQRPDRGTPTRHNIASGAHDSQAPQSRPPRSTGKGQVHPPTLTPRHEQQGYPRNAQTSIEPQERYLHSNAAEHSQTPHGEGDDPFIDQHAPPAKHKRPRAPADHYTEPHCGYDDEVDEKRTSKRQREHYRSASVQTDPEIKQETAQDPEQGQDHDQEQDEAAVQFDPTAPYDYVKELQEPWNEMMGEMVPYIDGQLMSPTLNVLGEYTDFVEWAERFFSESLDTIMTVYQCFHKMSVKQGQALQDGVDDILAQQKWQSELRSQVIAVEQEADRVDGRRQTFIDFRKQMAKVALALNDIDPEDEEDMPSSPVKGRG